MASSIQLYPHQLEALEKLLPGSILYGGVGSGKTLTALAYFQRDFGDRDLYVITTAKKRNTGDWEREAALLGIQNLIVDSWNNISNYTHLSNGFFIFDEQRVVGYGKWVQAFRSISKTNKWILLSGTPGDTWMDYMPVFIANGFYKNKTDFIQQHVEYDRFVKFPKIKAYHNQGKLFRYRDSILVEMPFKRHTVRHRKNLKLKHDKEAYQYVLDKKWNIFEDKPIENPSEMTQCLRKIVGLSVERIAAAGLVMASEKKIIVFYNYNYELEALRDICDDYGLNYAEWNGKRHQEIPDTDQWVYLVQYTAGAEGWNCIETNQILFYSLNYSYKIVEQAEGRIDRMNTPYKDLNYTYLMSSSSVDKAIRKALDTKTAFNESRWAARERKRVSRLSDKKDTKAVSASNYLKERSKL